MSEYSDSTYNIKTEIKQQQKHLSNKEISEIVVKYSSGISTYELAKEYGCHRRTISDNLKKQGIKVTNQLMERKGVVELVIQMYSEYIKPADIAKAVRINVDSVRKILKERTLAQAGIPFELFDGLGFNATLPKFAFTITIRAVKVI